MVRTLLSLSGIWMSGPGDRSIYRTPNTPPSLRAAPAPPTVSSTARLARSAEKAGSEGGMDIGNRNKNRCTFWERLSYPLQLQSVEANTSSKRNINELSLESYPSRQGVAGAKRRLKSREDRQLEVLYDWLVFRGRVCPSDCTSLI
jgi:hypothetical protein